MYRRSFVALAPRTIVRDPRIKKAKLPSVSDSGNAITPHDDSNARPSLFVPPQNTSPPPLPFAPTGQNQQSIGSMVGSYMLAGFGMGLGVILVRFLLGG